ncbi:hypothetical protein RhiirA4_420624 [Rhizophagus irregularis]|uniref:Uncharacterized protein n=1 Tax=Rhizophagus irregularis TaxID=588596 RepID=A0A2I1GIE9_9GLOM|nr:hypothetical protein RhiirA4_420624 [Rhizophagus irregularis]
MDRKKLRPQSWPECLAPISYVTDNGTQTGNIVCDHEAEINSRVNVLQKQMLKYNKETFGRFMQNLTREHEERIKANNQLRHEINKMKTQVQGPINLRTGYDMKHVFNSCSQTDNYRYEKVVEIEKQYDYLSIIRPHEPPQQWAERVTF